MDATYLRSRLHYDADTGVFTWLERPLSTFASPHAGKAWNKRYPGTRAGTRHRSNAIHIAVDGRLYQAHRLAWLYVHGAWPKETIDHINRDPSDNRLANLREATCSQNAYNKPGSVNSTTPFKGVSYNTRLRKFVAQIKRNKRHYWLGLFDAPEEAHRAYCAAARVLHGEFAHTGGAQNEV